MRRTVLALSTTCWLVVLIASSAAAQDKTVRGTVTSMAADKLTIKTATGEMTFAVDAKTSVIVSGGGTATRAAEGAGKAGPQLSALLKAQDAVDVTYSEAGGAMRATSIRRVASASGGPGTSAPAAPTESSEGTVETVTANSLSISGSRAGGTFKQQFTIDGSTKVVGVGAGTVDAAKGGKMAITDYVAKGDRVTVTFDKKGDTLHAVEVRVRNRAK
jgi:hypothetical protein